MINERLKEYLKDDFKQLEFHTNEIIDNIIYSGKQNQFKTDIEKIERIFLYWNNHIKNI